ncbi:uncharacterized protein A1O9_10816 [Exophiala aquamarina CBS 119918]|uniref:Heterokaryon incompatibility domain-containing protein n=1 Tax=Exophiala aquamarina CBS 119918 TaxID=1182545 RepID=A0A072PBH2_9EURO|nr:uncharacterized protein A1O9_10816 [Exophiala aquamarina CBS 119918]KEF52910.1 hypothetical protein A1O9_10816 [Exophiala aquamarina CBS 119918]
MESPIAWFNLFGVEMTGPLASCVQFGPAGREYDGLVLAFQPPRITKQGEMTTFRSYTNEEIATGRVNFAMIQEWLKSCNKHQKCRLKDEEKPDSVIKRRLEEGELRLIDVLTLEIVRSNGLLPYVALSYVIAQQGAAPTEPAPFDRNRLPDPDLLPQTIKDALQATKAIGERYLWISAYCIDQTDADEKQRLIGKMDLVYEGAALTICVLTPTGVGPGMYGVSLPIVRFDQVIETNSVGTFLTVQIPRLVRQISSSLWQTRGWTFQEAVISRRCLLFTSVGVALWCRSQIYHEAFNYSDASVHDSSILGPLPYGIGVSRLPFSFRIENESFGNRWLFNTWNQIVHSYTSRQLTYNADAEKAIMGIFNRYSEITGTPIVRGLPLAAGVCSLVWRFQNCGSCERRSEFPSWTWLGWSDSHGVSYDYWITKYGAQSLPQRLELELPEGGLSMWGSREIGTDYVELRYEAQLLGIPNSSVDALLLAQLKLQTMRAFFNIRRLPDQKQKSQDQTSKHVWELLNREGQSIPAIRGRYLLGENLDQKLILPSEISTSDETVECEFLCIQHWSEQGGPHLVKNFGDVVTAIAISRSFTPGKVIRIGAVAIPYESWCAAKPEAIVISLD